MKKNTGEVQHVTTCEDGPDLREDPPTRATEAPRHRAAAAVVASATVLASTLLAAIPATPAAATILPGVHQIQNRSWPLCLTVIDNAKGEYAPVGVRDCVGGLHQRWERSSTGSQTRLKVASTGLCLGVQWTANGFWSQTVQWPCDFAPIWTIRTRTDGWSEISTTPPAPGRPPKMCLDKNGWNAIMWNCHNPHWQQWQSLG